MTELVGWMVEEIRAISSKFKNRVGGADSTRAAIRYMQERLKPFADSTRVESFRFHPHAFVATIPLQAALNIGGILCFLCGYLVYSTLLFIASALCHLLAFLAFLLEFVFYRQPLDRLYPQAEGLNLFAERKASAETKRRIILCGHADAAYEIAFFHRFKTRLCTVLIAAAVLSLLTSLAITVCNLAVPFSRTAQTLLLIVELSGLLVQIPFLFFINWRIVADGANDNLTGCLLSIAVLKEMAQRDQRFAHTDVCCLITDGEESALRGALAFAKRHKAMLDDCETIVIVLDTIHELEHLMIYHRGINFTQKNSDKVVELLHKAGLNCGKSIPKTKLYPGGTDAEAFSRYGIHAASLCAVQHAPVPYYHTRLDTGDNLDADCLHFTYTVLSEAVSLFDREGYRQPPQSP